MKTSRRWTMVAAVASAVLYTAPPAWAQKEVELETLALGVGIGHVWLLQQGEEEEQPSIDYASAWFTLPASRHLQLGGVLADSFNLFGCDEHRTCYEYELLRVGALVEGRLVISENAEQGLEAWAALSPEAVLTTERDVVGVPADTAWGVGVTGRLGLRVRLRVLTLSPYLESLWTSVAGGVGYGAGLQLGLRF